MTIFGWDLSHYDGPDSRKAVDEGLAFFTHKAGGDADDAEIGSWWNLMKGYRASVLLGAYWVLYPGHGATRADQFLARLDATCRGWRDGPFILQLDCEQWGGNSATVPSKSDIKACCDRLRAKVPKLMPIVYAPKWVYGDSLKGLGYPLWASSYVTGTGSAAKLYPGNASVRWDAYSGQVPAVLQYSSSATIAGQTTCDANAFRGTLAQLTALIAPGWQEDDMPLTPADLDAVEARAKAGFISAIGDGNFAALNPATSTKAQIFVRDALRHIVGGPTAGVDVAALAAALNPLLDGVDVTSQVVAEAFRLLALGSQ